MGTPFKRRWFRLSLKTLLALVTMLACFLAGWMARDRRAYGEHEPVRIDGVVIRVTDSVYELSVGEDDCIVVGNVFAASRHGKWLGEIVVNKTNPDRCFGTLKPSKLVWIADYVRKPGAASIRAGDSVRTDVTWEQMTEMRWQHLAASRRW